MFETKLKKQLEQLEKEKHTVNSEDKPPSPGQAHALVDPRKDYLQQIKYAKMLLAHELPIRAAIYGVELTQELIENKNREVYLRL